MKAAAFLAGLPLYGFDLMMVDPPTRFATRSRKGDAKSPQAKYRTMTITEIAELPIGQLAAPDCVLFMWWTWPLMIANRHTPKCGFAFADPTYSPPGYVLGAWGFHYVTAGAWLKRTRHGKVHFGRGYGPRNACDPFIIATKGSPLTSHGERNFMEGLAREHSRKPDEAYAWCERYLPGARRLDAFSRESRPGWTSVGDEAGLFDRTAGAS